MKRIVKYTSYEGSSVNQVFVGIDVDSLDMQEYELDKHYHKSYGICGFTKETIRDDSSPWLN